jgi:hypothetical protein
MSESETRRVIELLTQILGVDQKILEVVHEQRRLLHSLDSTLQSVENILDVDKITGFVITQQGDPMALLAIAPGNSPVYTATPTPAGTAPGAGLVPTWTSSDPLNAPVTADVTGLIGTVAIPATAVVGTVFTLTISLTNADGSVATGTLSQTIVAGVVTTPDVTGFSIAQTA